MTVQIHSPRSLLGREVGGEGRTARSNHPPPRPSPQRDEGDSLVGPRRRGFSLVEMLVVIVSMSVLLGVAVTTLTLLMRAGQTATSAVTSSLAVSRLAHDFRREVRAASAAEVEPGENGQPARLRLSVAPDRRVIYWREKTSILRREMSGDEVLRAEKYSVDASEVSFTVPESGQVTLAISTSLNDRAPTRGRSVSAVSRRFQIDATVGADRRFQNRRRINDSSR